MSVVSVLKALPSTVPLRTADWRLLIGKSGFVTSVGLEKGGATRSTRSLFGASGELVQPGGGQLVRRGLGNRRRGRGVVVFYEGENCEGGD
jgi:hypothetical protein